MNAIYRIIWSHARNAWVVASEITKAHGKSTTSSGEGAKHSAYVYGVTLSALVVGALFMPNPVAAAVATCVGPTTQSATGTDALACGQNATASGSNSVAVGANATAKNPADVAFGFSSYAEGINSLTSSATALGGYSYAKGAQAVAVGSRARAEIGQSIAIGNDTRAIGAGAVSIGGDDSGTTGYSSATYPIVGYNTSVSAPYRKTFSGGDGSTAIAPHAQALSKGSTAIGVGATAGGGTLGAVTSTEAGIALYAWTPSTTIIEGTAVGALATAVGSQSTALGYKSLASNTNALAIGSNSTASAVNSLAVGGSATSQGDKSVVIGVNSSTSSIATNSVAVGIDVDVTGARSIAIGGASATNVKTLASSSESVAIGSGAQATLDKSVALGSEALTTRPLGSTGYVPNGKASSSSVDKTISTWKSTHAALAIGDDTGTAFDEATGITTGTAKVTRQITGVAAGARDTDAVNVAQLRAASQNYTSVKSTVLGNRDNDGAQGAESVALGPNTSTEAGAANSVAIGSGATAGANQAANMNTPLATDTTAVTAGQYAIAIGEQAKALGNDTIAVGRGAGTGVKGYTNILMGQAAGQNSEGSNSIYLGQRAGQYIRQDSQTANLGSPFLRGQNIGIGMDTLQGDASASSANASWGENNTAVGLRAGRWQQGSSNTHLGSFSGVGQHGNFNYNGGYFAGAYQDGDKNVNIGVNAGSGSSSTARTVASHTVNIGDSAVSKKNNAVAIGLNAKTDGVSAIAIGEGAQATADKTISIGKGNVVSGEGSGAIGDPTNITGAGTYSVGNNNGTISASNAGVFGNNNTLQGNESRIVGNSNTVNTNATGNMVMGSGNNISGSDNVTLGNGNTVNGKNIMVLGSGVADATLSNSVILGASSSGAAPYVPTTQATVNNITYGTFAGSGTLTDGQIVSVGKVGLERQIKNVAAGQISSSSTDAINGSQLYATNNVIGNVADSVKTVLGGTAAVGSNGSITMTNIGDTGKNTVDEAIKAAKTEVTKGTNIASIEKSTGSNGQAIYTVNAEGTVVAQGSSGKLVVSNTNDTVTNDTTYTVDLSDAAVQSLAKADTALQGWTATVNGTEARVVNQTNSTVNFVNGSGTTASVNNGDISYSVKQSDLTTDATGNVTANTSGDSFATADQVAAAINKAATATEKTTTVVQGSNTHVALEEQGNNAQYTVSADKTTVSVGTALTKTEQSSTDGNKAVTTDYVIDLADTTKADIQKGVEANTAVTTKGLAFTGDSGTTDTQFLGSTVAVNGDKNITTSASGNVISVKLNDSITVNSVTANTITAGNTSITSDGLRITDGPSITSAGVDAGNLAITNVGSGGTTETNAANIADVKKAATVVTSTNGSINVSSSTSGLATTYDLSIPTTSLTVTDGVVQTPGTPNAFVTAGDTATAINQAAAAAKTEVKAGTNIAEVSSTIGDKGQTVYTVNADGAKVSTASTALTVTPGAKDSSNVTDYAIDLSSDTKADIQKGVDANTTVATKGLTFTGDSGTTTTEQLLGSTISVTGDKNITTTASGSNIAIALKDDISVNSVTAQNVTTGNTTMNSDGITITNGNAANPVTLTQSGLNNGGNTITNLAAGNLVEGGTDAVNAGQLYTTNQNIAKGFNIAADNGMADNVQLGDTVTYASADKNIVTTVSDNNIDFSLAKKITVDSVTAGGNVLDGTAINVNGQSYTNVSDAINAAGKQAFTPLTFSGDTGTDVQRKLGETVKVVGGASDETKLTENNIGVVADGTDKLTVKLAKDINLGSTGSVTAGNTLLNNDGIQITNGTNPVSLTQNGLNNGGNKITNVQAGEVAENSTDAVNGSQLYAVSETANKGWNLTANGNNSSNVAPGGTVDLNNQDGNIVLTKNGNNITFGLANSIKVGDQNTGNPITINGEDGTITGLTNTTFNPAAITSGRAATEDQLASVANNPLTFAGDTGNTVTRKLGETINVVGGVADTAKLSDGNIGIVADGSSTLTAKLAKDLVGLNSATFTNADGSQTVVNAAGTTVTDASGNSTATTANGLTITPQGGKTVSLTSTGLDNGGNKITNIAAGTEAGDAVNFSQLQAAQNAAASKVESGNSNQITVTPTDNQDGSKTYTVGVVTAEPVVGADGKIAAPTNPDGLVTAGSLANAISSTGFTLTASGNNGSVVNPGETVDMKNTDGNIVISKTTDSNDVTYDLAKALKVDSVTTGDSVLDTNGLTISGGPSVTKDGIDVAGQKITNVANGEINASSTDAVNGSQLYQATANTAQYLGGGSTVDSLGNVTAPAYTLTSGNPADGATTAYNNVGDALNGLNTAVNQPLTFAGDSGAASVQKLGSTVTVKGGADTAKLADNNIGVVSNGSGTLDVKLAKELTGLTSAQFTDAAGNVTNVSGDGINITPTAGNPVSLTSSGLDNGGNQITNVASGGDVETNAANVGDVKKAAAAAKTEVVQGDNIEVTSKTGSDGQTIYTVATAKEVAFDKVTVGNVVLDKTTNTVAGLSNTTLGGADFATEGRAATEEQLNTTQNNLATILGGNAANDKGNVTMTDIGGTGANNINDAIKAANDKANSPLTFAGDTGANVSRELGETVNVVGGITNEASLTDNNIGVVANGADKLTVKLAKDINLGSDGSVTAGNTKVNDNGVTISNGAQSTPVSLTASGLDNGGNQITNVASGGDVETNAANVGDVKKAAAAAKTEVVQGDNIEVTSKTSSDGQTIYTVATAKEVAFDKVTVGDVVLDKTTNTVAGLSNTALGGADFATGGRAATEEQLNATQNNLATILGGNAANDKGNVTMTDIGGTGADNINDAIKAANDKANSPLTFAGDTGANVSRELGETVNVVGGITNEASLTDNNIGVVANGADKLTVKLAKDINLGSDGSVTAGNTKVNDNGVTISNGAQSTPVSLTASGLDNGGNQITNVASGGDVETNAANVGDVKKAASAAKTEVVQGDNIEVTSEIGADGQTIYTVATAKEVAFDKVTVGNVVLDKATNTVAGLSNTTLGGADFATAGRAATEEQLNEVQNNFVKVLGVNAANDKGNVTITDIGGTGADNINDAIKTANDKANSPLTFAGDTGTEFTRTLGSKVNVVGGATGSLSDNNIGVVADGTDKLTVKLAKDLADLNSATFNNATGGKTVVNGAGTTVSDAAGNTTTTAANGVTITPANGQAVSLTDQGLNNGGNKISNIAAGTDDTDAVNVSQLKAAQAASTTKVVAGDNVEVQPATNADGSTTYTVSTAKDLKVDSVTAGDTVLNQDGVSVGDNVALSKDGLKVGDVSVTDKGLNNGGNTITNVAAGVNDTDAVNVSQLKAAQAASTTKVTAGNNIEVTPTTNADGSTTYEVATAKDLNVDSLKAGDTTVNNNGLNIANGPSVTKAGIDAADTKVSNVAAGDLSATSKDAVNGSQLYATNQNVAANTAELNKGLNFAGDSGSSINRKLGDTLNVKGGATGSLTDNNIGVVADGTDKLTVKLAKDLADLNSATFNNATGGKTVVNGAGTTVSDAAGNTTTTAANGVTITPANGQAVSLTDQGLNNGGNKISNIAAGTDDTDAVNVNQLLGVGNALAKRIDDVDTDAKAGTASAMAVAGLPQAYLPGKSMMAVAGSTYRGESGYAIGFSSISDGGNWIIKGTASGNSRGHYGATAGVGYQW
ncbi:YadA-like family protein [Neisseria sp. S1]|uniref:YadA-like family protein n=1 Tax=Neisseria sp. S1 TaxID=3318354 RepID=UPI003A878446